MNFCPNCGYDLREPRPTHEDLEAARKAWGVGQPGRLSAGPEVVERPPTVAELLKPIPRQPTRSDFASDEAWEQFKADSAKLHREERLAAARQAWVESLETDPYRPKDLPVAELPIPGDETLLAWHLSTAKQDGAANAKAIAEWRAAGKPVLGPTHCCIGGLSHEPGCGYLPSDQLLVGWLRRQRGAG